MMTTPKPKPLRHFPARTTIEPGKPDTQTSLCGITSTNAELFTITGTVTCEKCLEITKGKKP